MKELPEESVRRISEQYLPVGNVSVAVVIELSKAIFPGVIVNSTAFKRYSLSRVDVMLQLYNGKVLTAQWERLFKASGDDGERDIEGHPGRFHSACDHKRATMTVVKTQVIPRWVTKGLDSGEKLAAGYNALSGVRFKAPRTALTDLSPRSILQIRL
jgi:hypothetical protein